MQVTITRIFRTTTDKKTGQPLINKNGKPYERVGIQTQEYGDKWLSGFGAAWNSYWKEGDTVNIEVEEKGQYINFEKVDELEEIRARLKILEDFVFAAKSHTPTDDVNVDDIPF